MQIAIAIQFINYELTEISLIFYIIFSGDAALSIFIFHEILFFFRLRGMKDPFCT